MVNVDSATAYVPLSIVSKIQRSRQPEMTKMRTLLASSSVTAVQLATKPRIGRPRLEITTPRLWLGVNLDALFATKTVPLMLIVETVECAIMGNVYAEQIQIAYAMVDLQRYAPVSIQVYVPQVSQASFAVVCCIQYVG